MPLSVLHYFWLARSLPIRQTSPIAASLKLGEDRGFNSAGHNMGVALRHQSQLVPLLGVARMRTLFAMTWGVIGVLLLSCPLATLDLQSML